MLTDIDHFKSFNDTYGHLTGDQVLRLVAMSVKQNVKGQDIAARYGGEEFAVVLPNTALRPATTVADHIRRAVMSKELMKRSTGEHLGRVTISIGVATLHRGDTAADPDRARRRLPLCRQAARPQPRDLRDRSGGRAGGADAGRLTPFRAVRPVCRSERLRHRPRLRGVFVCARRAAAQRRARPAREFVGIVVEPFRHAPVRRQRRACRPWSRR